METTFGRTVETRLIIRQQKPTYPMRIQINQSYKSQISSGVDSNRFNYADETMNKTVNARRSILKQTHHSSDTNQRLANPRKQQMPSHPQSSILMRKNYKYLFSNGAYGSSYDGYLSDSDCRFAQQRNCPVSDSNDDSRDKLQFSSKLSEYDNNNNNRTSMFHQHNREDANSKVEREKRSYCSSIDRFRSLDRQQPRRVLSAKNSSNGTSAPWEESLASKNVRLVQQLIERSNRLENQSKELKSQSLMGKIKPPESETNHNSLLLSPKSHQRHWIGENKTNLDSEHKLNNYLTWKTSDPQSQSQTKRDFDETCNITGSLKKTVNLRSISTPGTPLISSSTLPRRPKLNQELKIETWTEDEAVSRREQETRRSQSQHVKAPPKLNFAFTNEYDPISEHLNRPANRDRISSNNERVDYLFLNNRSRSIPNRGENPLSSGFTHNHLGMDYLKDHQPPNEVISLENALLNMNEIIRKLTQIAQKKDEVVLPSKSTQNESQLQPHHIKDMSPPLSTSTSLSFTGLSSVDQQRNSGASVAISTSSGVTEDVLTTISPSQKKTNSLTKTPDQNVPSDNISPVSSSDSSSIHNSAEMMMMLMEKPINKSSSSFSPSESSQSAASSSNSSSQVPQQPLGTNRKENNTKSEGLSFGKKLKRFLSINSSKSSKRNS